MHYKIKPADDIGKNCGFALLNRDGIKKLTPVFGGRTADQTSGHQSRRCDIFQLQLYYEAAFAATGHENLEGLRVLDVACGQGNCLEFLTLHFRPDFALGIDSSDRQIKAANTLANSSVDTQQLSFMKADAMNMAQTLRDHRRYDLILCIEAWNLFDDHLSFLHQARELLNQCNEHVRDQD